MSIRLECDGYEELLAVHRALMEAKFHETPNDREVMGSHFVANFSNQVVDKLATLENGPSSGRSDSWEAWRKIDPTRREWGVGLKYVRTFPIWNTWNREQRISVARIVMSPFILDDETMARFLEQAGGGA